MLLLFHITIALSSVVLSTSSFIKPAVNKLRVSYLLVGMTLASGTWLVISSHSSILSGCLSGLVYVGIVLGGLLPARQKLAEQARLSE